MLATVKPHSAELTCLPGEHVDRGTTTRRSRRSSRASSWRSNGPWTHLGESNWRRRRGLTLKELKKKKKTAIRVLTCKMSRSGHTVPYKQSTSFKKADLLFRLVYVHPSFFLFIPNNLTKKKPKHSHQYWFNEKHIFKNREA